MRLLSVLPLAGACALAVPAAAQERAQPNLVLTILAGAVTGHGLWTVDKQPLSVLGMAPAQYDTLRLSRQINSSIVIGAAGTYFPWPHLGFHAELSYLGLPADSGCQGLFYNTDGENRNRQMCDDIQAQEGYGGAITVFGGVTLRAASRGFVSPYLRGSIGVVTQSGSMVEVAGTFTSSAGTNSRLVIGDPNPRNTTVMFGLAAGFTAPIGSGYQFRLEVRDIIASLDRVTGAANPLAVPTVDARYYHHFALTLGFDVVLEQTRGRRY